jgi:hypothetical protein
LGPLSTKIGKALVELAMGSPDLTPAVYKSYRIK